MHNSRKLEAKCHLRKLEAKCYGIHGNINIMLSIKEHNLVVYPWKHLPQSISSLPFSQSTSRSQTHLCGIQVHVLGDDGSDDVSPACGESEGVWTSLAPSQWNVFLLH